MTNKKLGFTLIVIFFFVVQILAAIVGASLWVAQPLAGAALAILIGIPLYALCVFLFYCFYEMVKIADSLEP